MGTEKAMIVLTNKSKRRIFLIGLMAMLVMVFFAACSQENKQGNKTEETGKEQKVQKEQKKIPAKSESTATTDEERAKEILDAMTVSQKAGQVILARAPLIGRAEDIEKYQLGGLVLYENDFQTSDGKDLTKEEVLAFTEDCRKAAEIAPFLAVDEEGGIAVRVTSNSNLSPDGKARSIQELYASGGYDAINSDAASKSRLLLSYGINLNLAPVVDVTTDPESYIYDRASGQDAETTARITEGIIREMNEAKIGSVLKHFPGYGDVGDTHGDAAEDDRTLEELEASDFLPFKAGIEAGADCIMVSHILNTNIDPDYPVSLSAKAHDLLRNDLGFEGVILTDDLWMLNKNNLGIEDDLAPMALNAGNDLIISTSYERDILHIQQAIYEGRLDEGKLDEAVLRILKWKISLGVFE